MWSLVVGEGEFGVEIRSHLGHRLDGGQDGGVHSALLALALLGNFVLLLLALSSELLGLLLSSVRASKEGILNLADIDLGDIDLGRSGDGVGLVNAAKGDAVDLVGSSDQEKTRGELLKKDNALSSESSGEENKDSSGLDGLSEFGGLWGSAVRSKGNLHIVGGIKSRLSNVNVALALGNRGVLLSGSASVALLGVLPLAGNLRGGSSAMSAKTGENLGIASSNLLASLALFTH